MDQRIINLYDEYTHKPLTRTEFLRRLTLLTGSTAAALAVLPLIEVKQAKAMVTPAEDLFTEYITYPGVQGTMTAYVARPKAETAYPTVIVIHENRGLNPHIEDVARRAAKEGFLAIAPNALSPLGPQPATEDEARQKFQTLAAADNLQNFIHVFEYLKGRRDCNEKTGCVGFCWGGGMSNNLAVEIPQLRAAVSFYGMQAKTEEVHRIKAAVQLHYAALDQRINAGMAAYEEALRQHKISYEQYVYENVNHAFHNDTAPNRYDAATAKLAWSRTITFLKKHLA
ncbi:MAG TPA: dienelactone hydrolase family protein [Lacibacter sp.]|nr:dienelactone hydrolase family protein [Lacibacter sp.]HMO90362.1 dienelactone hydrolase family protein [Lacibacter sp.]